MAQRIWKVGTFTEQFDVVMSDYVESSSNANKLSALKRKMFGL